MTFLKIYQAVKPQEPFSSWSSEKQHTVVAVARKKRSATAVLRAMGLYPEDWTRSERMAIQRILTQ